MDQKNRQKQAEKEMEKQ
jgi:hypothetical protein